MKKKYKIQLPKGKTLTNITKISFKDGFLVIDAEIENEERFVRIATEKVEKAAKKLIKEYDEQTDLIRNKDALTADNMILQEYGENICVKEQQKYEPKDGEFIHLKWKIIDIFHFPPSERIEIEREAIAIFKEIKKCGDINGLFCYITYLNNDGLNGKPLFIHDNMNGHECSLGDVSMYDEICPATEKEKKLLIDKLAEVGKRWNEEDKTIEDVRWRAVKGKPYYYIIGFDSIVGTTDERLACDENRYATNNYFKTHEAAEKVAEQIREIFKNSKTE